MPTAHLTKSKSISRKEAKEQQELNELRDTVLGSLLGPKPQLPTPQEVLSVGRKEVSTREENFYHDRLAHYAYALHHRPTAGRVQFAKDAKSAAGGDEEAGDEDEEGLLQEYMSVAGRWQEVSLLTDESDPIVTAGVAGMRAVDEGPKAAGGAAGAAARSPAAGGCGRDLQEVDEGPHPPPLLDQLLGEPDVGASFAVRRRESLAATASTTRAGGRRSQDEGSRMFSGCIRGLNSSSSNYSIRPATPPCSGAMLTSTSGEAPGALPPPLSGPEGSSTTVSSSINGGLSATGPRRWSSAVMPRAPSLRPATARPAAGAGPGYGAGAGSAASYELRRSVDPSPHEDALAVTTPFSSAAGAGVGGVSGSVGRRASFSLGLGSASQASLSGAGLGSYGTAAAATAAAAAAAANPSPHPPVCLAGLPPAAFHAPPHRRASSSTAGGALATSATPATASAAAAENSASLTAMRSAWQLTAGTDSARSLLGAAQSAAPTQVVAAGARTDGMLSPPAASARQMGPAGFSSCDVVKQSPAGADGGAGGGGGEVAGGSGSLGAAGQAAWMPTAPSVPLRCVPRTSSCTAVIPSGAGRDSGRDAATARDGWLWAREEAVAPMQQRQAALQRGGDEDFAREEGEGEDESGSDVEESEQEEAEEEERSDIPAVEAVAKGGTEAAAAGAHNEKRNKKKKGKRGLLEEGGRAVESSWRSFSAGVSALRAAAALGVGGIVGRRSMRFGHAPPAVAATAGGEATSAAGLASAGGPPAVGPGTLMLSRRQRRASNVVLPYPYEHTSALAGAGAGDNNSNMSGAAADSTAAAATSPVKGAMAHTPQSQFAAMLETIRPASPAPPSLSASPGASSNAAASAALPARGPGRVMRVPSFLSPHPPAGGHSAVPGAVGGQAAAGGLAPVPSARPRNRRASLDETWLAASLAERAAASPAGAAAAAAAGGSGRVGSMGLTATAPLYSPRRGSLEIARSAASFSVAAPAASTAGSGGATSTTAAPQSQLSFLKRAAAGGGSPASSPVTAVSGAAATAAGGGNIKSPTGSKLGAFDRLVHSLAHALHKPGSKHH
ncbi:hypothetical protein HYH02_013166 [Chlamydomonas schloesseri]|uniref:Uncharacterized protein n=1 Tax=Chlamydomonas schloesseri TaxID=2026947 RepID=A0A835SRQ5_9CHLO|nr:hypothetical protein HYH02_013166 [Chlamydomonas schloesseri]|eukprot:KAG2431948.1 hypothetical protein HYH02_013166 [Chlamydomonas schloesseri]